MTYSVIIPYYEIPDLLVRAVDSIPERPDIEIIIINNGPTALSPALLAHRKNVQVLFAAQGKGAGAARNIGIERAKGKWLLMVDADDFFTPDAFEKMDHYANEEADIIFFYATSCFSDSLQPSNRHSETNDLIDDYLQTGNEGGVRYGWSSPWAKMIKRSMVEEHTIRCDEIHVSNDVMFSLQTGYWAKRIMAIKEVVYCVTMREGSLTQTPSLANLNSRIETAGRFNAFLKQHRIKGYRKSIMYYLRTIATDYGYKEAFKALWRSVRMGNNPFIGITRWAKTARKMSKHD